MNNKKKGVLITALIMAVFAFVGVGITAAYFVPNITLQDSVSVISVSGASITLTLTKGTTEKTIAAEDVIPGWSDTKNFKVTVSNESGSKLKYDVNLIIVENGFGTDMEYTLTGSGDAGYKSVTSWTSIESNTGTSAISQKLVSGSFNATSGAHNYVLTVRFNETGSTQDYHEKILTAYPSISTSAEIAKTFVDDLWLTASSDSLLTAIKDNTTITKSVKTTPMSEIATTDEGLIVLENTSSELNSIDDTGKASFFFRGAVENNYVEFANKCWRIVRIDGDNNIKLVLYNDNTSGDANPCSATGDKLSFINSGNGISFNSNYASNAYVGFMYGTSATTSFDAEHAHTNDSNILIELKKWYNSYFVSGKDAKSVKYQDYLEDVVWCSDLSVGTTKNLGYDLEDTDYGFDVRNYLGKPPTLNCPEGLSRYTSTDFAIDTENNAQGAVYKMGLLTADEVAFAGAKEYIDDADNNESFFLYKNAKKRWWLLSPRIFNWGLAYNMSVDPFGTLYFYGYVDEEYAARPAVSLKSTVTISGGIGTSSSPYVISGTGA